MKIWIDADAAPWDVKEIVARAAMRLGIGAVLVANRRLLPPVQSPHVTCIQVAGGPDAADAYIADHAVAEDMVITADIPLAAILVGKGIEVLDPRGEVHSIDSVGERLSVRNFMESLRGAGVDTGGSRPYGPRDKRLFAAALDRMLVRKQRGGGW